ncbi:ribosome association toxin RatA domain protein, partial [Vibrio parahaemolyticus EKP-028]
RVL